MSKNKTLEVATSRPFTGMDKPTLKAEQTAKHTPGPWQSHRNENAALKVGLALPESFYRILMPDNDAAYVTGTHADANARLIAAAPELLEALRVALPALEAWTEEGKGLQAWSQAKDAIRKATGE